MVFALTPVQSAFATHGEGEGARDIQQTGDVCEAPEDAGFPDINDARTETAANCLNELGIALGYDDGTYGPTDPIQRQQMASFLARKLLAADQYAYPENVPASDFSDRDKIAQPHLANVDTVAHLDIAEGYNDGRFGPGDPVTRAQMAAFIVRQIEEIIGEPLVASGEDHFSDDNGNWSEDNINLLADLGIVEGQDGQYNPDGIVTRGQMALFIARDIDALNNEYGITFTTLRETPTNQTFAVAPAEDQTVATGDSVEFTVEDITSETVDIALFACEDVSIDEDGNVVFADADNDDEADWDTTDTDAVITEVNDVAGTYGDYVDDAIVNDDGTITFTVETVSDECVVAVVFNDEDDNNALDLDADNMPTEEFGVGGELTSGSVAALDADPETATNRYGTNHTVTATLEDASGDPVALDGESVRFQVIRGTTTCDEAGDAFTGGTVVATGTDTTEDGVAEFTYTLADPSTGDDADTVDCINVFWDADNDGVLDGGEEVDVVEKTWSDDAAAASSIALTPEQDTNATGTQHTVTATVTDQFGDPVDGTVTFEVYREGAGAAPVLTTTRTTGTDGVVTFTYTGPATQSDDTIVACVDNDSPTDGCDVTFTSGDSTLADDDNTELSDSALKYWVTTVTADETATGEVIGFDTAADYVDVEDGEVNKRYRYDAGDRFFITCGPNTPDATDATLVANQASIDEFEEALEVGDAIYVDYDQDGQSDFVLQDGDSDSEFCS